MANPEPSAIRSVLSNLEKDRLKRWSVASRVFIKVEFQLTFLSQGLGRLDVTLLKHDAEIVGQRKQYGNMRVVEFGDSLILSYLWVLGAYELVRVINQRAHSKKVDPFYKTRFPEIGSVKKLFERIRIPLAKLEASNRNRQTDFKIAIPILNFEMQSTAWVVAPNVAISR